MLPKTSSQIDTTSFPVLHRSCNGKNADALGAFPHGSEISFRVEVPRSLGAAAVVVRIAKDGEDPIDLPFSFLSSDLGVDVYTLTLPQDLLNVPDGGLFYYEILFLRGSDTLFTNSLDNVNFTLEDHASDRFRLLIYRADFHTPEWFRAGTMYHIFPDRFFRGNGKSALRDGAELNEDWEHGIPQYASAPGEPLANNLFFGGNLWGVTEKLDLLASLGVNILYLSPVFEAASNHRYDTGNYETVDPLLGGNEAFDQLIREAHKRGMKIILDGVFNHTGDDSRYFNRKGTYPETGAFQSETSRYYPWYRFREYPEDYECWWGVKILPRLNHDCEDCRRYFTGKDGIAAQWIRRGADGWRLDVADELSNEFLEEFRETVKADSNGNAVIIGEVWENAADKLAYGERRRYLLGKQLDSVMNYPFRNAVLALLRSGDAEFFAHVLTEIYASYPREVSDSLMNLIGTHDTPRILTLLGDDGEGEFLSNAELAVKRLSRAQRAKALRLLKIAAALQFTVYGIPSVYYGDEAGLEGYRDPFCRMPYPWGHENEELLRFYRMLGTLRRKHPALHGGDFRFLTQDSNAFLFEREGNGDHILVAVNVGSDPHSFRITGSWIDCVSRSSVREKLILPSNSVAILVRERSN